MSNSKYLLIPYLFLIAFLGGCFPNGIAPTETLANTVLPPTACAHFLFQQPVGAGLPIPG